MDPLAIADLPSAAHAVALWTHARLARTAGSLLMIGGSVANGNAKVQSDLDLLVIVQSEVDVPNLCHRFGLRSMPEGSEHYDIISFARIAFGVRVSVRVMSQDVLLGFFGAPHLLWRTTTVAGTRPTPQLLFLLTGEVQEVPWPERKLSGGYVFDVLTQDDQGAPALNVEGVMLLVAKGVTPEPRLHQAHAEFLKGVRIRSGRHWISLLRSLYDQGFVSLDRMRELLFDSSFNGIPRK